MEFLEGIDRDWILNHWGMIVLSAAVVLQWVVLQALMIHYHFFRENLKKPTPDGIRFSTIEKVLSFQASQIDRVFGKLSEMNKEFSAVAERRVPPKERPAGASSLQPLDSSVLSLGEVNLKKRLNELKTTLLADASPIKSTKLN